MSIERPQSINHGHYPSGTGVEGVLLSVLFSRQEKAVIFTSASLVERLCDELRQAGVETFRFDSQPSKREEAFRMFTFADSGALVTSTRMDTGWRANADVMIFASCIINLDKSLLDQCLQRAPVKAVHYVNCIFTGSSLQHAMDVRGIPPAAGKHERHSLHSIAKAISPALDAPAAVSA